MFGARTKLSISNLKDLQTLILKRSRVFFFLLCNRLLVWKFDTSNNSLLALSCYFVGTQLK